MAKLPKPRDLSGVGIRDTELRHVDPGGLWWRVHRSSGTHAIAWNALRYYGPVDTRFEPHDPPPRVHTDRAVWYAAATPRTCIAEVFQRTGRVPLANHLHLVSARMTRPLTLLDITGEPGGGTWATRAGASMALATGRHDYTSAWARAICAAFPDLDGIAYHAAKDGGLAIALFHPARDAMPTTPVTRRALNDPALGARLAGICDEIGYRLV